MINVNIITYGSSEKFLEHFSTFYTNDSRINFIIHYNKNDYEEYQKVIKMDFFSQKNIFVFSSEHVYWGHISIVDAMIKCFENGQEKFPNSDYNIFLDSRTIPNKTWPEIIDFLEQHNQNNVAFFSQRINKNLSPQFLNIKKENRNHYLWEYQANAYPGVMNYKIFVEEDLEQLKLRKKTKLSKNAFHNLRQNIKKDIKNFKFSSLLILVKNFIKLFFLVLFSRRWSFGSDMCLLSSDYWKEHELFYPNKTIPLQCQKKYYSSYGLFFLCKTKEMTRILTSVEFEENYNWLSKTFAPEEQILATTYMNVFSSGKTEFIDVIWHFTNKKNKNKFFKNKFHKYSNLLFTRNRTNF